MKAKQILVLGGVSGMLAVLIGAFGAHGLQEMLTETGRSDTFETAVKYQFYHTFALMIAGVLFLKNKSKFFSYAAYAFVTGIIIFSGSLYTLCLTNISLFGAITPFGGLLFILGWLSITIGVAKSF